MKGVIDTAKHIVKCYYCGKSFDASVEPFEKPLSNRYAHLECAINYRENKTQEQKDKEALEEYIKQLFGIDYITPRIQKQIKTYVEEYYYTYTGILKALKYHYEIKKNDISKANGAIGIVPYTYQNAYNYYYELWLAQQRNAGKEIKKYTPPTREVVIQNPQRKPKKKRLFSFLDEEE